MMNIYFLRNQLCLVLVCFIWGALNAQIEPENYIQTIGTSQEQLNMIFIEGGVFDMGSKPNDWGHRHDEGPLHEVSISPFWIGEVEITWNMYKLFVNRNLDLEASPDTQGKEVKLQPDVVTGATVPYVDMSFGMGVNDFPAICMTQLAATRFCQWLSAITGYFYRLPTEAEWEYACRAGTTTPYSFGDDESKLTEYAWFKGNSQESSHKVKQKKPNPWGLYDMHGNVAEWTLDQYADTGYEVEVDSNIDPVVLDTDTYPKSVRGGSWMDQPVSLRSASRMPSSKKWKSRDPQIPKSLWWHTDAPFVGLRIVRPLQTPSTEEQNIYWNLKSK